MIMNRLEHWSGHVAVSALSNSLRPFTDILFFRTKPTNQGSRTFAGEQRQAGVWYDIVSGIVGRVNHETVR